MFHLIIVNKCHLTVTPSWHDGIYSYLHIINTARLLGMVGRGQDETAGRNFYTNSYTCRLV